MKQNQLTLHAVAVARKIVYFYAEIVKFGHNFIIFDFFFGGGEGANWEDFFFEGEMFHRLQHPPLVPPLVP